MTVANSNKCQYKLINDIEIKGEKKRKKKNNKNKK